MSKWKNVPIPGVHDWDGDLRKLLDADTAANAPLEVDWTDPDAIAASRGMVADAMLPALADALHGIADRFADVPPVGRLAIIGGIADAVEALESFMGPVIVSQVKPGERCARAALGLTSEATRSWPNRPVWSPVPSRRRANAAAGISICGLADGSALFVGVERGKPPEFRLAPWWQGEGDDE